jgi:transcriptional regulator
VPDTTSSNLVRGTVDLLVLKALEREATHGFAIARWIRDGSDEAVHFEDAALYQSLHRLERQGLVESSWGRSETNRRARFYCLTTRGRRRLASRARAFRSYADAVTRLLEAER